jgi:ankyrin repeat protein
MQADHYLNTPLFYCAHYGDAATAATLIERGANVSAVEEIHGSSVLHQAAYRGQNEVGFYSIPCHVKLLQVV